MAVKLTRLDGQTLILPATFRMEGLDFNSTVPTIKVEGHDGAIVDPNDVRLDERPITISGTYVTDENTAAALAQALQDLRAFLASPYPYQVYADEMDTQYLTGTKQKMSSQWVQGTGRCVARVTISYVAADPFLYSTTPVDSVTSVMLSGGEFVINNPGTAPARPIVTITGGLNGATFPKLSNTQTGRFIRYNLPLPTGAEVEINTEKMTAFRDGVNALPDLDDLLFTEGFDLMPGPNRLRFEDENDGGHSLDVRIQFTPRYY